MNLPGLGIDNTLVIPNKKKVNGDGSSSFLKVVSTDKVYDIVQQVHSNELKHSGYKKVLDMVQKQYYGITRSYVQEFCTTCPTCQLSQPQTTKAPLKPIIENNFLQRLQMDLIDMRNTPDGEFHYIAQVMDHFSKFHILLPTKTKEAEEITCLFKERVLAYFGAPHIFHSDNGWAFCNQVLTKLMHNWSQKVTFVNGRPRHSQSQGLVERGNRIVEEKIAKMKTDQNLNDKILWASWLPEIMYFMNVERHRATEDSPYRVVFGRVPPAPLLPQSESRLINEEDCNVLQNKDNLVSDFQEPISVPQKPIPAPRSSRPKTPPVTEDNLDNTPDPVIPVEDYSLRDQIRTTALENTKRKAAQMLPIN